MKKLVALLLATAMMFTCVACGGNGGNADNNDAVKVEITDANEILTKAWEEYNAQILLDARKNAGLTQSELAKRIGAEKGYISRIERGLIVPSVSTLYRIAAAMGLTVELRPM